MAKNSKQDIQGLVRTYAAQFGVPYELALAVLERESSYDPRAVSPKGAQGLFQLMPATQKSYNVTDPFDPSQNIRGGVEHLSVLLKKYKNNLEFVLADYNAGEPAVTQAGGVPPFPETQEYVASILSRFAELQAPPETPRDAQPTPRAVKGLQRGWIYPTEELQGAAYTGRDFLGNVRDEPLPPDDPKRQGVMVSFTGDPPTEEEIYYIFSQVDPQGFVTREDLPGLAAGTATTGADVARLAERGRHVFGRARQALRPALSIGGRAAGPAGWAAMPLIAGAAGAGAEFYRQSLVPETVTIPGGRTFGIDSWPRENAAGIEYEGAPNTAAEKAWAAMLAGVGEGTLELGGAAVARGLQGVGRWYKGTGFHRPTKVAQEGMGKMDPETGLLGRGTPASQVPAEYGILPTQRGAASAANIGTVTDDLTTALVSQVDEALNNPVINKSKLIDDFAEAIGGRRESLYGNLGFRGADAAQQQASQAFRFGAGTPRRFSDLGHPQLEKEAMRIAGHLMKLGDGGTASLSAVNNYRKAANRLASAAFTGPLAKDPTPAQTAMRAAAKALRKSIIDAMKEAESTVTGRGLRGFFGRLPRSAERFEKMLDHSHKMINASQLAFRSAQEGAPGVFQAGLGYGLAPAVLGGGSLLSAAGVPPLAAGVGAGLTALGVSQLLPTARAATGGAIFRAGAQAPSVPANLLRLLQGVRTTGTEVPGSGPRRPPAIDLSSFFPASPPPAPPQMLQPPLEGQSPHTRPDPFAMMGARRRSLSR